MDRAKELAEAHWGYIKGLLEQHGESARTIELIGWHYKTSMVHGYGHGAEDKENELNSLSEPF
jgi:hypothetical protein